MRISDWSSDVCSSDLVDHLGVVEAAMHQEARQVTAENRIGNEQRAEQRQFPAHDAPRRLEHQQGDDGADHEVGGAGVTGALDQVAFIDPVVEGQAKSNDGEGNVVPRRLAALVRSEEHTSELQSLMRISYAVLCLQQK